ncbi:E3 SUMO-protein ligase PIAS1-like isoform X2 [Paramacrobiotus metropolitanus]|uniref:E3 SUMO-protein ligase PIAS1-like isoform X2 n=1 Tax=Paramacrobiotus metropolitanus TaxID=2943436 RepID=UPI002445C47B|nr:E3 SUMO-protein ligase PIAS1-like isoform X2 [Paramacrobiotus metropolitanus]
MGAKEHRFFFHSEHSPKPEKTLETTESHMSFLHRRPSHTFLLHFDLRKNSSEFPDTTTGNPRRTSEATFPYTYRNTADQVVLISLGLVPASVRDRCERIVYPPCVEVFFNKRMKLQVTPVDPIPHPEIAVEVPVSELLAENRLAVTWMDPVNTSPDFPLNSSPLPSYAVSVFLTRRKRITTIVEEIKSAVKSLDECVAEECLRFTSAEDEGVSAGERCVSLACPVLKKRPLNPARGRNCPHVECYDVSAYVSINFPSSKARWKCPYCSRTVLPQDLRVDEFFQELLKFTDKEKIELFREGFDLVIREPLDDSIVIDLEEDELDLDTNPTVKTAQDRCSQPAELSIQEDIQEYVLDSDSDEDDDNNRSDNDEMDADDDSDPQSAGSSSGGAPVSRQTYPEPEDDDSVPVTVIFSRKFE